MALQTAPAGGKTILGGQSQMEIRPQIGNFPCIKDLCTLWNADRQECYDKTQARALSRISDNYAVPHGDQ